jgi:hypothetical protein
VFRYQSEVPEQIIRFHFPTVGTPGITLVSIRSCHVAQAMDFFNHW